MPESKVIYCGWCDNPNKPDIHNHPNMQAEHITLARDLMHSSYRYDRQVQEVAGRIGLFFLEKNNYDFQATRTEIERMRINHIYIDSLAPESIVVIETSRPGLMIGKRGQQIHDLQAFINIEFKYGLRLVETMQHIEDHLIPQEPEPIDKYDYPFPNE